MTTSNYPHGSILSTGGRSTPGLIGSSLNTEEDTNLPPLLSSVQFLLDLLQRRLWARRRGGPQLGAAVEGGRLQDDLEGLAAGPLAELDDLHVSDVAEVQVHHPHICGGDATSASGQPQTRKRSCCTVADERVCRGCPGQPVHAACPAHKT